MDPENSLSRVERTLWAVWCYITEAVGRFVRPQPTDIVNNDPNSNQDSAASIEHPRADSTDDDTCSGGADEEQLVARSSLPSSSRPVVTWDHCNTDEESMQHKTEQRKDNESKEDGDEMREEHHSETENDHSNDLRAKEDKQEMMDVEKLHTCAGPATPENDACEGVNTGPPNLKEVAVSEERTEGETDAEKETSDDHPAETQVKEEHDQMHDKEEPGLEAEDTEVAEKDDKTHSEEEQEAKDIEVRECIITNLRPEEEERIHEAEPDLQKNDALTLDKHPRKDEVIKQTQLKEDEEKSQHEEERDLGAEDSEVKMCIVTSLSTKEEDYMHQGEAEALKEDVLTLDEHPAKEEIIKETEDDQMHHEEEPELEAEDTEVKVCITGLHVGQIEAEEDEDKTHREDENDLEAEDGEVEVCIITSISQEDDDRIHEGDTEAQKKDAGTLDDHPREDDSIKETKEKEEADQMHHEEEPKLEAEDTEVKVCITGLHMRQIEAEEDEDKTHREDENDLEAEDGEVEVCIITSISQEDDDRIHEGDTEAQKKDAGTLDDHPREDDSIKETEEKEEADQMHHEEEPKLEAEDTEVKVCITGLHMRQIEAEEDEDKTHREDENDLEAEDGEVKVCIITDDDDRIHEGDAEAQKKDAGTLDDHPREDDSNKETEEKEEADRMQHEEEQALGAENIDEAAASEATEVSELDKNIRAGAEGSEEDVRVQAVQTTTGQTGVTIADISVDERLVDQETELSISRETYTKEGSKEILQSGASVTVKPEGETAQETSEEFKNIPMEISEGQFAMPQELNTPTCEEIQEGVSKYNNELWGADENTTQRFLEAGDCEEIPATQLPEEVESGERESLQNSVWSTGADYLLLKESMEEKQESKEETETSFDLVIEEAFQESGKEEGKLLAGSMKTEATEAHVAVGDEIERRSEELHDGTNRSSFSKEGDCETKEAVAATEVVRFVIRESVQALNLVQSISGPSGLQEDAGESGFVRHSLGAEPKSVDSTVEMQDNAIKREERGHGGEEGEAEDGIQSTKEMENSHLPVTETAGELIAEERPLNAESGLPQDSESQEIKNQSPDSACEIRVTQIIEAETADESRPKDLPATSSEVKSRPTNGNQDVIEEELLDLWIETVMSEGTDDIKQEEPEPGQLSDAKADTLSEERGDLSLQEDLLAESVSGESEVVTDTEMSSSTVESGFLGQALRESGAGSFHWIHDVLAEPEEELLMDTIVESPEGRLRDQESQEKTGEERVERADTESGSQKAHEDVGEVVKKVEAEEERLDISDESEQAEGDTQGETRTESEKNTLNSSSLDGAESSLPGLNKAEAAKEPRVMSEDVNEVDGLGLPVLDFAMQRSRIAVKNPRVRPPKNPRSLLHMPSAEPTLTPTPPSRQPVKIPGGVPLGGMGIGIKLPGLGAGFPVLKKRQPAVREENTQETVSQEPETKPKEKSEAPQLDETPKKPRWMPPKHPGFGNPLMAELQTKLKKTPKE